MPGRCESRGDKSLTVAAAEDVGLDGRTRAAQRANFGRRPREIGAAGLIVNDQIRPASRQLDRAALADAAAGTGDEGNFSSQPLGGVHGNPS